MSDHLVLYVDRLITAQTIETLHSEITSTEAFKIPITQKEESSNDKNHVENGNDYDENQPLIHMVECRICQEEDHIKNLETPCACSGSLKYAHRACVQRWCNEKGDIICEICHQSYKPGYTAPPQPNPEETTIDISGGWTITGSQVDLRDPRILAMAAAQRRFLESEYDEYATTNASGAAFCRSAALILMALLLLRHALFISDSDVDGDGDDDASAYFSLFLLRAAGFLLPCYIMAWAISILQSRRQRQEAATEVAFILQSRQPRGLQFTIAPDSPTTPQQEPHQ